MIWLLVVVATYLLVLGLVAWLSVRPFRTPVFLSPGAMGAAQEEVHFDSSDGVSLRGWWMHVDEPRAVAVLAHGYMMNRSELVPQAVWLSQRGVACLLVDLRAHGKSGGNLCGFGWRERDDVAAAAAVAQERAPGVPLILMGSSMGSAASAFTAAQHPGLVQGLVLDSAYSTLLSGMFGWWRFLGGKVLAVLLAPTVLLATPVVGARPSRVDVARALRDAAVPTLLLHGDEDTLALPSEARRNAEHAGVGVVWLEGCGHSEGRWMHPERYFDALGQFVDQVAPVR